MPKELIKDKRLFPRSEYYSRFEGTTAFAMTEPDYWGSYHRSDRTRFSAEVGKKDIKFESDCTNKDNDEVAGGNANSYHAHTGNILSPFSCDYYREAISLSKQAPKYDANVRDRDLQYRRDMAKVVLSSFEKEVSGAKKGKTNKSKKDVLERPIVIYENDYPCVLVQLPILNPKKAKTPAAKFWAKNPKSFQKLILATFIALLNDEAQKNGIPIEMVIRASFGHNLPSICETENTFRINVGIIPKEYAELIGKTLVLLNNVFTDLTDKAAVKKPFNGEFQTKVRHYNVKKLKTVIDTKKYYQKLKESDAYKNAEKSEASYEKLYQEYDLIYKANPPNKKSPPKTPRKKNSPHGRGGRVVKIDLAKKTIWAAIRSKGSSKGKPVLGECFRKHESVDWFANLIMENLTTDAPLTAIEMAVFTLLQQLDYQDKVTMNYEKIHEDLAKQKLKFKNLSFKPFYKKDAAFNEITQLLFTAFCAERPDEALYSELERAGTEFFSTYRGSAKISKKARDEFNEGSESEFSADLSAMSDREAEDSDEKQQDEDEKNSETEGSEEESEFAGIHISHSKLRVCSGMKAVMLAQYGALYYLKESGEKKYQKDASQTYYEVADALKFVRRPKGLSADTVNKIKDKTGRMILHYDLNYCNAANQDHSKLIELLSDKKPAVVILDYTSSTLPEIREAIKECLSRDYVKLIIFVDSGLKNNQGGQDFNPYGEVRVIARDRVTRKSVIEAIKAGLSEDDKLSLQTHEMVRAAKQRGLAPSFLSFFKKPIKILQAVKQPESKANPAKRYTR